MEDNYAGAGEMFVENGQPEDSLSYIKSSNKKAAPRIQTMADVHSPRSLDSGIKHSDRSQGARKIRNPDLSQHRDSGFSDSGMSEQETADPSVSGLQKAYNGRQNSTAPLVDVVVADDVVLPPPVAPILSVTGQSKVDLQLPVYEEASQAPSSIIVVVKWFVMILCFLIFLVCIVSSKLSVIHMTAVLQQWSNRTQHDSSSGGVGQESVYLMLLLTMVIPYVLTFIRSAWCGGFRSDRPWPSKRALAWGVTASVAESAGLSLFTLDVLPHSPSYIGLLLMNGVFLIPIICQTAFSIRRHRRRIRSESRCATVLLLVALVFALTALVLTACFEIGYSGFSNHKLWEIPVSILLLSFAWCPLVQKIQLDPPKRALQKLVKMTQVVTYDEQVKRHREAVELSRQLSASATPSVASSASSASSDSVGTAGNVQDMPSVEMSVNRSKDPKELPVAWAHPQFSARWKMAIITNFIKLLLIPGFAILWAYALGLASVPNLMSGFNHITTTHPSFPCFMINVFTSFGGYLVGWGACVMGIHQVAFTAPLILGTPVALALIMIPNTCSLLFHHLPIDCQLDMAHRPEITLPAACFLYISQLLSVGFFLFKTITIVMPKESQIFWLPGYNSIFLEQHFLLSRKNKQTDAAHQDPSAKAQKTRVYICTTMYREARREMEQLLKSYARVNKAKQWSDRHFQAHIFLDNGVRGTRLTPFALQLVSIITSTLGVVIEAATKVTTPYGMTLSWLLPSEVENKQGMYMTVHLKDNRKVKNKKRWSQIMYMSYVLDYAMRENDEATDEDSFILTTDADIKFAPSSVEALLDLMTRDPTVGAVCSRTHPMGSGPLYWFQIFNYAIGHWLQKAANHVLGSVLCCPGCFSVFRVAALRDVIATYGSSVTEASEFLTKDMGEDRWLCTLMVQAGWRLDYCAAAENSTYVPEEFDEFFKQQRRWIPSSMANLVVLMQEWMTIFYFNKQIPLSFIAYQGVLLISALLNPSVSIIIIVGGLFYGWEVDQTYALVAMLIVTFGYAWICLSCSSEVQLKVAKFLTIGFSLVMAVVVIGMIVKLVEDLSPPESESTTIMPTTTLRPTPTTNRTTKGELYGRHGVEEVTHVPMVMAPRDLVHGVHTQIDETPRYAPYNGAEPPHHASQYRAIQRDDTATPPSANSTTEAPPESKLHLTAYYFFGIVGIFLISGLMHLDELHCLVHGVWYLLTLPAGNLILVIYSLCNLTDRSWGTREEKKAVSFGDVTDWKQTVKTYFWKVFFCCGDKETPSPPPSSTQNVEDKSASPAEQTRTYPRHREPDPDDHDDDDDEIEWRQDSGSGRQGSKIERKLSFKFHYDDTDSSPVSVKNWLPSNFRPIYAPLFIKKGYDDTSFLTGLSEAEVAAVGIKSKAHISAILSAIKLLPELDIEPCVPDNVEDWLKHVGLQMYRLNFRRSCIVTRSHLEILRTMSKQDIEKELGINKPGHLRRLRFAIENLRYPTPVEQELAHVKYEVEALAHYNLKVLSPREHDFWEALKKERLLPDSVAFAHDLDLKEKLTELRNNVLMIFAISNALWLILITTLVTKTKLNVLGTTVLDLVFIVVFGMVLVIMFLCMIVHRVSTWMHVIARAPLRCGDPYKSSWSWGELTRSGDAANSQIKGGSPGGLEDSVDVTANIQKREAKELTHKRHNQRVSDIQRGVRQLSVVSEEADVEAIDSNDRTHLLT